MGKISDTGISTEANNWGGNDDTTALRWSLNHKTLSGPFVGLKNTRTVVIPVGSGDGER